MVQPLKDSSKTFRLF